jgi:NTP pyrophosphatase (non-canonical NTP hydrolase)
MFDQYKKFVDGVTSGPSKDLDILINHIQDLSKNSGLDVPRFITAGIGISSEAGEISELVKKVIFQGKPFNNETRVHLAKEMGDLIWYITQMCILLNIDLNYIMEENVAKLQARYPGGFAIQRSEVRKEGDI